MARFHRLAVYPLAQDILRDTHDIAQQLRGHHSLRDQMRRSSISIVSNICEGSERGNDREFRQFLRIARASNGELHGQWHIAAALELVSDQQASATTDKIDHLGRMLTRFISRLAGDG